MYTGWGSNIISRKVSARVLKRFTRISIRGRSVIWSFVSESAYGLASCKKLSPIQDRSVIACIYRSISLILGRLLIARTHSFSWFILVNTLNSQEPYRSDTRFTTVADDTTKILAHKRHVGNNYVGLWNFGILTQESV